MNVVADGHKRALEQRKLIGIRTQQSDAHVVLNTFAPMIGASPKGGLILDIEHSFIWMDSDEQRGLQCKAALPRMDQSNLILMLARMAASSRLMVSFDTCLLQRMWRRLPAGNSLKAITLNSLAKRGFSDA